MRSLVRMIHSVGPLTMIAVLSVSVSLLVGTYYDVKVFADFKQLYVVFGGFCLTLQVWKTSSVPAALTSSSNPFQTSPSKTCMFHTHRLIGSISILSNFTILFQSCSIATF